ncbi:hypothetical protein HWV62_40144 [Athelia sp. TMB]|nr:hypothetical protein HWV62_40144 [Athelia sp. TMB]
MVNYHALTSTLNLSGTRVVVLGGTSGIGAGIAVRFAALGSSVLVMGRNESAGNDVVRAMQSAAGDNTTAKLNYGRADLGSVAGIKGAVNDIAAWARWVFAMDLFTEEFNRRFPGTRTMHAYPGNVATNNMTHASLPWIVRCIGTIVRWFGRTTADYAEIAVWQIASDEWKTKGWAFFDQYARKVMVDERVLVDDKLRADVWNKMLELGGEKEV